MQTSVGEEMRMKMKLTVPEKIAAGFTLGVLYASLMFGTFLMPEKSYVGKAVCEDDNKSECKQVWVNK